MLCLDVFFFAPIVGCMLMRWTKRIRAFSHYYWIDTKCASNKTADTLKTKKKTRKEVKSGESGKEWRYRDTKMLFFLLQRNLQSTEYISELLQIECTTCSSDALLSKIIKSRWEYIQNSYRWRCQWRITRVPESKFFIRHLTDKLDVDLTERMEWENRNKQMKFYICIYCMQCAVSVSHWTKIKQSTWFRSQNHTSLLFSVLIRWISDCMCGTFYTSRKRKYLLFIFKNTHVWLTPFNSKLNWQKK